jgi:uncharacterized protein
MGLKEQLRADLTDAIRSRDELRRSALRMVLTAISKAEVAGKELRTLSDDEVVGVIRSELGKRREAAGIYDDAGRTELANRERDEAEVLAKYLPPELDDHALRAVIAEEVARTSEGGVSGPKAMGAVIKAVRARVGAQAEGSRIAAEVRSALGVPSK